MVRAVLFLGFALGLTQTVVQEVNSRGALFWDVIQNERLERKWPSLLDKLDASRAVNLTQKFETVRNGKPSNIKFHLEYPDDWSATDVVRPHIVQELQSRDVVPSVLHVAKELPQELDEAIPDDIAEGALALAIGPQIPASMTNNPVGEIHFGRSGIRMG